MGAPVTESYRTKTNWSDEGETEWRLDRDAVVQRSPSGWEFKICFADIQSVRLWQAPLKFVPWRWKCRISSTSESMTFDNTNSTWWSTDNRSNEFAEFTRVLLLRLPSVAPQARALAGTTPLWWFTQIAIGSLLALFVAFELRAWLADDSWSGWLLPLSAGLFVFWIFWSDVSKERPRVATFDELRAILDKIE